VTAEPDYKGQFTDLMEAYASPIRRLCAVYADNAADREDLSQDIFFAVWRALPGFRGDASVRTIDFRITLTAAEDVTLGDTKEGAFAIRLAEPFTEKKGGRMVDADGRATMNNIWGKRSNWVDYTAELDSERLGVAIFDHPGNPRHPTYWHARDYGLFAANPFGVHDFESKPKGTGNFTVAAGKSATFRYRFYLHPGDDKQAKVSDHYREYVSSIGSK
jgi:hypothetical protein